MRTRQLCRRREESHALPFQRGSRCRAHEATGAKHRLVPGQWRTAGTIDSAACARLSTAGVGRDGGRELSHVDSAKELLTRAEPRNALRGRSHLAFLAMVLAIIVAGSLRSAWSTRLDSFAIDEGWHVIAGVSYERHGAFWLNPEHPPLVKRWIAAFVGGDVKLPALPRLHDKDGERDFVDHVLYEQNDFERIQARVRVAMLAFN